MDRKILFASLLAAMPMIVCAQETKLVNCRTLEAAGYFVGPDEVLDNEMVCQKAKPGAAQPAKPQPPKPLPGTVISDSDPTNVTEAAKAAEKRVAAAREAIAAKEATAVKPEAEPEPATTPPAPSTEPVTATSTPAVPAESAAAPAAAPAPEEKPEIVLRAQPPAAEVVAAPEPAPAAAPSTPPASVQPAPANAVTESAPLEQPAPQPASPAAESTPPVRAVTPPQPAEIAKPAATENSIAPAPASAVAPQVAAPAPQEAATPPPQAPEKVSGFYDANAGTTVVTVAPSAESPKTGTTPSAEPANPPAEAAPPAEADAATSAAAAMAPPDDPNEERERVVRMGAFEKPREEGPDPTTLAHKTTFLPGDEDGFQEGQRPECTKNITLGSLKDEKLVLGTPGWAEKWIGKNQKRMPQVCFSATPMQGARNYLIVFYTPPVTAAANGAGLTNTVMAPPPQGTPDGGVGTFTTSYGSTWHYSVDRTVGVTVLTRNEADEPHSQPGRVWYSTAYTEEGVPVAQHWPEQPKHPVKADTGSKKKDRAARETMEHVSEDLLNQMVEDILKL